MRVIRTVTRRGGVSRELGRAWMGAARRAGREGYRISMFISSTTLLWTRSCSTLTSSLDNDLLSALFCISLSRHTGPCGDSSTGTCDCSAWF